MRKARVFPDPVLAAPTKSLPSNKGGIDLACISVNVLKPMSPIAFKVFSQTLSLSESKVQLLKISKVVLDPGTIKSTCVTQNKL